MEETQHKTRAPIGEDRRMTQASAQWLLESQQDKNTPIFHHNELKLFICGEDAFKKIAEDLKQAKASVDIICWGFDPAMELIREKNRWPRGDTWGGLLRDVSAGKYNGGKPVKVRLLSWHDKLGLKLTNNMPSYGKSSDYELRNAASRGMGAAFTPGGASKMAPLPPPTDPIEQREYFNANWYKDAFGGKIQNLWFRTRNGDKKAVEASLKGEPGVRGFIEEAGMEYMATDHQKTILIDYEHEDGAHAVGYVMGLNSVTDYWDTQQHIFNDPKRGASWEGVGDVGPGLKPYQDYACRIVGEALVMVSKNFTDAWNRAPGMGEKLARVHDVCKPPTGLCKNLGSTGQRAQIVRTQPEEQDKSIKRLYRQASSFARQYVYIENQYFQDTDWAVQLKEYRKQHVKGWEKAGKSMSDMPNLHVMAVIPTPEKGLMVPRTYDTVKSLGQGTSMPNQDKDIEKELDKMAKWDAYAKETRAKKESPNPYLYPGPLSAQAQSAKDVGDNKTVAAELKTLGMRSLIASLWTYNHDWRRSDGAVLAPAAASGAPQGNSEKDTLSKAFGKRYREIYIHSKLMMIDDSMFTLGSANLNLRSMAVDAEINVASDDAKCCEDLRKRVWNQHTKTAKCNPASLEPKAMATAFIRWADLMRDNAAGRVGGLAPTGFIFPFEDTRTSIVRAG